MTLLTTPPQLHVTGPSPHHELRERILRLYERLSAHGELEPGPTTDRLFGALVAACRPTSHAQAEAVLRDPAIMAVAAHLRELCADGESRLERCWSLRIAGAPEPEAMARGFPYWHNYRALTRLELHALAGAGVALDDVRRVCFLGGGPLPLSALMLHRSLGVPVDVADHDAEAAALASVVASRLGATIRVHPAEAAACPGLEDADVVLLAALVGVDPRAKGAVLRDVRARMRPGSLLLARSAHGLRELLYPVVDLDRLPGWNVLSVVHPYTDVVNSVVVAAPA